jgi:hypothetical protein
MAIVVQGWTIASQEKAANQASHLKAARAKAPRVVQIQAAGVQAENCTKFRALCMPTK